MGDTLQPTIVQRRTNIPTASDPGYNAGDDAGWDSQPPYGNGLLTTVTPNPVPIGVNAVDSADPAQSPTGMYVYRQREITGNGALIPIGPQSITASSPPPPPPSGKIDWVRQLKALDQQCQPRVTVDFQGNPITAGACKGRMDFGDGTFGANVSGGFLVKYSNTNALLWKRFFGVSTFPVPTAAIGGVVTDSLGNIFICGWFAADPSNPMDFGGISLNTGNAGTRNLFMAKYGPGSPGNAPNALWVKQYTIGGVIDFQGIAIDNSGNPVAIGYFQGPTDFHDGHGAIGGAFYNLIILRLDNSDGHTLLAKPFGGGVAGFQGLSIATTPDGLSIAMSGLIVGSGTTNDYGAGPTTGPFFATYDGITGNFTWGKQISGIVTCSVTLDPLTKSVYLTGGYLTTTVDLGGGPQSSYLAGPSGGGVFVAGYDSSGNWRWSKVSGAGNTNPLGGPSAGIGIVSDGSRVYIVGNEESGNGLDWARTGIPSGTSGFFVSYFDTVGNYLNVTKVAGSSATPTGAQAIAIDPSLKKVVASGFVFSGGSTINFDGTTFVSNSQDGFLVQYEP